MNNKLFTRVYAPRINGSNFFTRSHTNTISIISTCVFLILFRVGVAKRIMMLSLAVFSMN